MPLRRGTIEPAGLNSHPVLQCRCDLPRCGRIFQDLLMPRSSMPTASRISVRIGLVASAALLLAGCSMSGIQFAPAPGAAAQAIASVAPTRPGHVPPASAVPRASSNVLAFAGGASTRSQLDSMIAHYADAYDVPARLVHRVIVRESGYNPAARNGPYYGLMQISAATARGMGFRGEPSALLDAETNLRFAVRYLAGAYVTSRGNEDEAYRLYASGYYYHARDRGLIEESGLR
jgi:soluble lytic murein transglycosylase-like protein